jgi:hypothetical protein
VLLQVARPRFDRAKRGLAKHITTAQLPLATYGISRGELEILVLNRLGKRARGIDPWRHAELTPGSGQLVQHLVGRRFCSRPDRRFSRSR